MQITKWIVGSLVIALLGLSHVGCTRNYDGAYLVTTAAGLKCVYADWMQKGRPADYKTTEAFRPGASCQCFEFTNTMSVSGALYHCRFAARSSDWPRGVLAITDEGVMLWIRDRDGKVTISPEKRGIEP